MTTNKRRARRRRPYQLVVQLDTEDHDRLRDTAELEKLTQADVVRRALRAHARRVRSQHAIAS